MILVYAAQPREGTETGSILIDLKKARQYLGFMQLNPARGRKPNREGRPHSEQSQVYAAQPREGTETMRSRGNGRVSLPGLCSSTPRGDGNSRYTYIVA